MVAAGAGTVGVALGVYHFMMRGLPLKVELLFTTWLQVQGRKWNHQVVYNQDTQGDSPGWLLHCF